MPLNPTLPAQRVRAAIKARLSDVSTGFNPYLAACVQGTGLPGFTINFSDESGDFLQGKYSVNQIIESDDLDFPLIAIYQGASVSMAPNENSLVGTTFSGEMVYGLDVFLASSEGQPQSEFDLLISCVHDAVMNAMNTSDGLIDFARRQLVWGQQTTMGQPSRIYDESMSRYFSQMPFMLRVSVPQ